MLLQLRFDVGVSVICNVVMLPTKLPRTVNLMRLEVLVSMERVNDATVVDIVDIDVAFRKEPEIV